LSEDGDVYRVLQVMNERMTDIQKSYLVLNDNHHLLAMKQLKLETKLETIWTLLKFCVTPGIMITIVIEFLRIVGVVN
jgi:hypothetical protein